MKFGKLRFYTAGLLALLIGMPLTERALAQPGEIIDASINLAESIIRSAGNS